jgi:LmbE family N-acetylglucosaminyl deacetylase
VNIGRVRPRGAPALVPLPGRVRWVPVTQQAAPAPPERILVVTAHPDDVDFGCAGSIATWTSQGIDVAYCIVTDGDAGGFDEAVSRTDMARIRREEQTDAAREVGVTELHFLGYPDGRLLPSLELRRDISRVIRQVKPQRVVTQSPQRNWQRIFASHPDHLAAGEAALCAVYPDSRNPFAHPELLAEGFEPHTVPEVWLMGGPEPDMVVDVTDTFPRKVAALRRHHSQVSHREDLEDMLRGWLSTIAKANGLPEGRLAEAFRVIPTA